MTLPYYSIMSRSWELQLIYPPKHYPDIAGEGIEYLWGLASFGTKKHLSQIKMYMAFKELSEFDIDAITNKYSIQESLIKTYPS